MTDDRISRTIDQLERALTQGAIAEIEQGLALHDSAFVRRFRHRCRVETFSVVAVVLLLVMSVVLLAAGLVTLSWPYWVAGELAFLLAFAAGALRDRTLRRTP
jgi:protein-S-isoprenylcysteine O-methyltransferase Ste14